MIDPGGGEGLDVLPDGRPQNALRRLVLDDWHDAAVDEIDRAAAQVAASLPLVIGTATRPLPDRLRPLVDALTLTLAGLEVPAEDQRLVTVADPRQEFEALAEVVTRHPQASVALGQLLRQTSSLDTLAGLAAEAAVYSMLLGGTEFASWLQASDAPRPAEARIRPLVQVTRDGNRLSVTLDHPERRNAFSFRMREALFDAMDVAMRDDAVEHVELSGAGAVFCSGGDLAEFGTAKDLVAAYLVRLDRAPWRLIDRVRNRVTVRVHGAAVGAGIEMAAFADRLVAAPDTFFLLPEIEMGLVPGAGGTVSVTRRVGRWRAAWMTLSGARVDTETALKWGLVDEISDHAR